MPRELADSAVYNDRLREFPEKTPDRMSLVPVDTLAALMLHAPPLASN